MFMNNSPEATHDRGDDFTFTAGLPPLEVHQRARAAAGMLARAGKELASWLVEIEDRKIFRHFACSSIYNYGARHLGLASHTVA